MTHPDTGAADLFRAIGLMADGPAVLGRPVRAAQPGVYVIELPAPRPTAPIELTRVGKWLERVPDLQMDGGRPSSRALSARLAGFWLPSRAVLFIGSTGGSVGGRLLALEQHVLGDARPFASAQWLKTLRVEGLRVWWAATTAPEEYEDALQDAFAASVPDADRQALHDATVVLPFANQRTVTGERKRHGISGAVIPEAPAAVAPPTTLVDLPPAAADGAHAEERGSGTTRRTNASTSRPGAAPTARSRTQALRAAPAPAPGARTPSPGRVTAEPVQLSADGLARFQAELEELVRVKRPEVIGRIKSAKELGDLKENADYTAAREEQSFLEGRIQELEARLRDAVVVERPTDTSRVTLGSRVTVEIDGDEIVYTIVGSPESDVSAGRISAVSPVGRALVGRSPDEVAVVRTPGGEARYRVVAID